MATTPAVMNVTTPELIAEDLLAELSEPTAKAEELIAELRGWSECNPNPEDPNATNMRDVFDQLIQDPSIIAALQALRPDKPLSQMASRAWTRCFFNQDTTPDDHSDVRLMGNEVLNEEQYPDGLTVMPTAMKIIPTYDYERGGNPQLLGVERVDEKLWRVTQDGEYLFSGNFHAMSRAHYSDEEIAEEAWPVSPAVPALRERFADLEDSTHLAHKSINFTLSVYIFRGGAGTGSTYVPVSTQEDPTTQDPIQIPFTVLNRGSNNYTYSLIAAGKKLALDFNRKAFLRAGDEFFFRVQRSQTVMNYGDRPDSLTFAKRKDAFSSQPDRDTVNFMQITRLSDLPGAPVVPT